MRTLIVILITLTFTGYGQKNIRAKVKGFENDSVVQHDIDITIERYVYRNEACIMAKFVKEITPELVERYVEEFNAFLYLNDVSVDEYSGGENVPETLYFLTPELVYDSFVKIRDSYPKIRFLFFKNGVLYDLTIMQNLFDDTPDRKYMICFGAE